MTERRNIAAPMRALCVALELEPERVRELTITPRHVRAIVYRLDDEGSKFVEDGSAAVSVLELEVQT